MMKNEILLDVKLNGIEEAQKKADLLVKTLEKATQLAEDLTSKGLSNIEVYGIKAN